jgi:very-short-patch-repair endonuclease
MTDVNKALHAEDSPGRETDALAYEMDYDHVVNYAAQQNAVPVVKEVRLENRTDEPLEDIRVQFTTDPEFANPYEEHVARIQPRSEHHIVNVDLKLSARFLSDLRERTAGHIWVEIYQGDEKVSRKAHDVELLAYDEWSGLRSVPEILAAFVLPNHPVVEQILSESASLLLKWTGDGSLSGYQTQSGKRVWMIGAAIFSAIQKLQIKYINPPASFETTGQKIRTPDRIYDTRLGTCLDLVLLYAACLEQAGLRPLIALQDGHAFGGFWLKEDCFPEPNVAELLTLRKRVQLQEIFVCETTFLTQPGAGVEAAEKRAHAHLEEDNKFYSVLDVHQARKSRILPLPLRGEGDAAQAESHVTEGPVAPALDAIPHAPELPDWKPEPEEAGLEDSAGRISRWKHRLLDLSLRNRLLNFRDTKKTIPFLCADIPALEDALSTGKSFEVHSKPKVMTEADPRNPEVYQQRTGNDAVDEYAASQMQGGVLHARLTETELDRRLIELFRAARLSEEESGANTLFLALGFLAWKESATSDRVPLAPLLLLPVDLRRKSLKSGFRLQLHDDDPVVNVTLLQKLEHDFDLKIPGLDPLPQDEAGVDVPKVFQIFRKAVRDIEGWEVREQVGLSLFSFTKYLMWKDLQDRLDALRKNPVVEHLIHHPKEQYDPDFCTPDARSFDEAHPPAETFCPMDADSSQLGAIFAAAAGKSFVLEGPPGTGKSQTITNIIAHSLALGRTVLFVSEKMAALSVVRRRLDKVGLGRFCLELHSSKSRKQEVLQQLGETLRLADEHTPAEWQRDAEKLGTVRNELNVYVEALHRKREAGFSVFQATSRLIGLQETSRVPLKWESPSVIDRDIVDSLLEAVQRLATTGTSCGDVPSHPWKGVQRSDWTHSWVHEVEEGEGELSEATDALATSAAECGQRLGLPTDGWTSRQLELMNQLSEVLLQSPSPPQILITGSDWETTKDSIDRWNACGARRDALREELFEKYDDSILKLPLKSLAGRWAKAEKAWVLTRWFKKKAVRKILKGVRRDAAKPNSRDVAQVLTQATELAEQEETLRSVSDRARQLLGRFWKDGEADWTEIAKLKDWVDGLRSFAPRLADGDLTKTTELRTYWAEIASQAGELLTEDGPIGKVLCRYRESFQRFAKAHEVVKGTLDLDVALVFGDESTADVLGRIRDAVRRWRGSAPRLRDWCAWRSARTDAAAIGLYPLIRQYEAGDFSAAEFPAVFDRSFYEWWVEAVIDKDLALRGFYSPEHNRKIEQFRELDQKFMKTTELAIAAELAARLPKGRKNPVKGSELGTLIRELQKKGRHMPVRKLLGEIPNVLPRLKPCLLMSPLSVAQYLDPAFPLFDLVIFDEASQIPVWDAVGAIARGKTTIIVGDPKQLPPTSFFSTAESDEPVDDTDVEDLESILDDCIGASIPQLNLDWHYRSRREGLIAFSNYHYYNNRLLTFPAPHSEDVGVTLRIVEGAVYDKGKTRTNRGEADAIVQEIVKRLLDPVTAKKTIGVVTFSIPQQTLIEDLLDVARREHPEIDPYFSDDLHERVFVKNLENVQGDERDSIFFSICYGPDMSGRVFMNFGPINREGGQRRLNVAITRAREEVLVFSTLRAEDIDLARTNARGVRDLKSFLDYAEKGPRTLAEAVEYNPEADFDSPFEREVHDALVEKGWGVHRQVGCSGYRIDLAVVDPQAPGRYLLGIECDGANYHSAKTARDRDRIREAVLCGLGWKIHRIWSSDWWADPQGQIEKLHQRLSQRLAGEPEDTSREVPAAAPVVTADLQSMEDPAAASENDGVPHVAIEAAAHHRERPYEACPVETRGTQEDFYDVAKQSALTSSVSQIIRVEGPINGDLLAKRVGEMWSFGRMGGRSRKRLSACIPMSGVIKTQAGDQTFYWSEDSGPEAFEHYRVPQDGAPATQRDAKEIVPEEITNAILALLEDHVSLQSDDLLREAGRLFGLKRLTKGVEAHLRLGMDMAFRHGLIEDEVGTIVLKASVTDQAD